MNYVDCVSFVTLSGYVLHGVRGPTKRVQNCLILHRVAGCATPVFPKDANDGGAHNCESFIALMHVAERTEWLRANGLADASDGVGRRVSSN